MIKVELTNEMVARLVAIERCQERFCGIRLPVRLSDKLRKRSRKRSSYASVKIEGNPLSEDQASEAIDSSRRHFLKPEQEVRNYYAALEYLEGRLSAKAPFSKELVLGVQAIVVRGESREKRGFRGAMPPGVLFAVYDDATGVPEYIPPAADEVEGLVDELVRYVAESDDHPILKAAVVHYQLVTIHPFEDGNGRTARLMGDYVLDCAGYGFNRVGSLEEYFAYDIDEYYRSLQMGLPALYYDGRNNPPQPGIWMGYFLRMVELHAKKSVEYAAEVARGGAKDALAVAETHLNRKERAFYAYLRRGGIGEFRPVDLAARMKVTNRTIINWCSALAKVGLVVPESEGIRIRKWKVVPVPK